MRNSSTKLPVVTDCNGTCQIAVCRAVGWYFLCKKCCGLITVKFFFMSIPTIEFGVAKTRTHNQRPTTAKADLYRMSKIYIDDIGCTEKRSCMNGLTLIFFFSFLYLYSSYFSALQGRNSRYIDRLIHGIDLNDMKRSRNAVIACFEKIIHYRWISFCVRYFTAELRYFNNPQFIFRRLYRSLNHHYLVCSIIPNYWHCRHVWSKYRGI